MFPLSPEIISLGVGSLTGFIFKMAAQAQADKAQMLDLLLKKQQGADNSSDSAAKRVTGKAGEITRRFIVIAILFGVILAPFVLALLNKPVIVEVETPIKTWFYGLLSTGGATKFYELSSYILIPELRSALLAIIGFYFGNAAAKRTNL